MNRSLVAWLCLLSPWLASGADLPSYTSEALPAPRTHGGRPLMEVLQERKSTREFSGKPVDIVMLGNLLWAAFGINRPETGQRTAPCTMNLRCIDIYLVRSEGTSRYLAETHALENIGTEDARRFTGGQTSIQSAPVALVYVADHAKFIKVPGSERDFYAAADAGFIGQNVYLFCASEGLGCVVHMPGDRTELGRQLGLRNDQKIVLVQSVGFAPVSTGE